MNKNNNIEYEEVNYIPYKNGYIKHRHIVFKEIDMKGYNKKIAKKITGNKNIKVPNNATSFSKTLNNQK